jgi:hypothetical protein
MEVIHITPERNIKSIMKNGIIRSKPLLDQYNTVMKKQYGDKYDSEKGLVFCFPESTRNRDKFIKDFLYWKSWGDNRNKILVTFDYEKFVKYKEDGYKIFSNVKPKLDKFSVLLLDIKYEEFFSYYLHAQNYIMGSYWIDMDERYEHDNKPLVLVNYDIKPNQIKRVIGTAESFNEQNKINITLNI